MPDTLTIVDKRTLPNTGGGDDSGSAKYQFYECADGQNLLFCCIEPKFWRNFCVAVERPDLIDRHDGEGPVDFGADDVALRREVQTIIATRSLAEWTALAAEHVVRDRLPDPVGHRERAVLADVDQEDRELVAAVAAHGVDRAHRLLE